MIDYFIVRQTRIFLYAVFCGMLLSAGYDGWKLSGRCLKLSSKVCDMFYWMTVGVVLFLFTEWNNQGNIRGYLFLGWLLGWVIDWWVFREQRNRIGKRISDLMTDLLKIMKKTVKMMLGRR